MIGFLFNAIRDDATLFTDKRSNILHTLMKRKGQVSFSTFRKSVVLLFWNKSPAIEWLVESCCPMYVIYRRICVDRSNIDWSHDEYRHSAIPSLWRWSWTELERRNEQSSTVRFVELTCRCSEDAATRRETCRFRFHETLFIPNQIELVNWLIHRHPSLSLRVQECNGQILSFLSTHSVFVSSLLLARTNEQRRLWRPSDRGH